MARYKVSYKVLRQQGEDIKAAAKMIDGYADRVSKIRGRLGGDNMLAEIRNNLNQLGAQLGESRAILNTAGELLVKNVESYGGVEARQVKKVGGMRAHNRDFYKNPVVVASAGGAAGGIAATGAAGAATPAATTINYSDNSVNVAFAAPEPETSAATPGTAPIAGPQSVPAESVQAQPLSSSPIVTNEVLVEPPPVGMSPVAKAAAGLGAAGVVAAGAVLGGREIKKRRDVEDTKAESDPETELENARRRLLSEIIEEYPVE
jgi:hypothetical protein